MIKGIKAVIFDLDGTLIDAYKAIIESFNFTMSKIDHPKQKSGIIRRAVGWGDENLLRPFVKEKDLKKALGIYRKHHRQSLIEYSRLLPGAALLLKTLRKKGYKLAVASNRPTKYSDILLRHLDIKQYFHYILCGDKLKQGKPHPEILYRIIDKFGVLKKEAIYVGDMTVDAQAGRNAGVRSIIVTTGSSSRREIMAERPFRMISRVSSLLKMF